jgi:hypothetical protein
MDGVAVRSFSYGNSIVPTVLNDMIFAMDLQKDERKKPRQSGSRGVIGNSRVPTPLMGLLRFGVHTSVCTLRM